MAANNILPFGATATNELTQSAYVAEAQRLTGNQPGKASSKLVNKAMHQMSLMATGLAQFIADRQANAVSDTLTPTDIANYLLAVLTGPNLLTTPPQFDNDTSPATTAFVQRALGSYQAMIAVNTPTTLTAGDSGKIISLGSTGSVTLPLGSTVISGTVFNFISVIAGRTVTTQGADTIFTSSSTISSLTLNVGDTACFVWNGGQWVLSGGTLQLGFATTFGAVKAQEGYQRLPGGMLLQWGGVGAGSGAVVFPIAFPVAVVSYQITSISVGTVDGGTGLDSWVKSVTGLTGFSVGRQNNSVGAYWMALGY